ncbi:hypothetical protein T01_14855 [Trichinella spiralis]|uniref:Uncharacterized protein n=1 Tax=Trichinella spiralis TaxID=6334 RepID=A0A0V1BSG9_TRISP|nr:hypothetical protein T01_14855 [Trichinella spiralis]
MIREDCPVSIHLYTLNALTEFLIPLCYNCVEEDLKILQLLDVEWDKEIFLENHLVDLLMIHKEHREIPNPSHHQYLSTRLDSLSLWSSDSSDDSSDSPVLTNILLDNGFSLGASATICPSSVVNCWSSSSACIVSATSSGLLTDSCSCGNFNLLHLREYFPFLPENLHFPYLLKHCYNFTKNLKNYNDLRLIGFSETRQNPLEIWFFINHTCIQLHTNKKGRYLP